MTHLSVIFVSVNICFSLSFSHARESTSRFVWILVDMQKQKKKLEKGLLYVHKETNSPNITMTIYFQQIWLFIQAFTWMVGGVSGWHLGIFWYFYYDRLNAIIWLSAETFRIYFHTNIIFNIKKRLVVNYAAFILTSTDSFSSKPLWTRCSCWTAFNFSLL